MDKPTFAELHGIPDVPEKGNLAALTGNYIPALAELHARKILDLRPTSAANSVTAHGASIDGAAMFIDIGAFTQRSKELTLGQINFWTNRFYKLLWPICEEYHATFDKAIGDSMLLVFSPQLGCKTPLASAVGLAMSALAFDVYGYYPHVGIASGKLWLGYSGPPPSLSLTVLGGVVNLAARLASKADEREICLTRDAWGSIAHEVDLGEKFFVSETAFGLKGLGETNCVRLKCNTQWFPQCAIKVQLVDSEEVDDSGV